MGLSLISLHNQRHADRSKMEAMWSLGGYLADTVQWHTRTWSQSHGNSVQRSRLHEVKRGLALGAEQRNAEDNAGNLIQ